MLPTPSCYMGATVYSLLRVSRGQTASIGIESVVTEPLGMGSQLLSPCVVSTVHIYVRLCRLPVPSPTGDSTLKDPETLGVWRIISSVPGGKDPGNFKVTSWGISWLSLSFLPGTLRERVLQVSPLR